MSVSPSLPADRPAENPPRDRESGDILQCDVLVVGAGISGLTLARELVAGDSAAAGDSLEVLVAERRDRVGGNITTNSADGFLWEEGPNSFAPAPELLDLAVSVGLKDDLVLADGRLPRYVFWNGELMPVPMSPIGLVTTRLLSPLGKLRAGLGALGFVPPAIGAARSAQGGEETVRQFVERHLGREVVERLVQPFVSGVYAGSADTLSMASAFRRVVQLETLGGAMIPGTIRLLRQRRRDREASPPEHRQAAPSPPPNPDLPKPKRGQLGSFREGLKMLPLAIAGQLGDRVKTSWHVEKLHRTPYGTYVADIATPQGLQLVETRRVVLTSPAAASADLLWSLVPEASRALQEIPYPPVACVVLGYPDAAFRRPLDGFGNLIPRSAGLQTLGSIWGSCLFPGRAPEGWNLILNFIGGATNPAIAELPPEAIADAVHQDLKVTLLRADAAPPKVLAVRLWPRAIPQYVLGHQDRLDRLHQALDACPGLYTCSNYEGGVSLGDCIRTARDQGRKVAEDLRRDATRTAAV